jgi:asparagine synthase (glutamine-hydrolysing)
MMGDSSPGLFLSGGADSAAVAAAARVNADKNLPAYILDLPGKNFSEADTARQHAEQLGFEPVIVKGGLEELAQQALRVGTTFDQPMSDPASLGLMALSEAARDSGSKFVLTGDGADEVFGTYQTFDAHKIWKLFFASRFGQRVGQLLPKILHESEGYFSLGFRANRFAQGITISNMLERDLCWRSSFSISESLDLLARPATTSTDYSLVNAADLSNRHSVEARDLRHFYLDTYLSELLLTKLDRSTMRFGVEARSPFLGKEVLDAVLSLSLPSLSSARHRKALIWKVAKHLAPMANFDLTRKHGFGIPLAPLFQGPLRSRLLENLDPDRVVAQGIFKREALANYAESLGFLSESRARKLWVIFAFQEWYFESEAKGLL